MATSRKIVATLLVFIVILVVAPINVDAQDQDHNCYADCEKNCVDEGNARSFCMLKCEKECIKGNSARRLMQGLEPQTSRRLMQVDVDDNSKPAFPQPDHEPDSAKEQDTAKPSV